LRRLSGERNRLSETANRFHPDLELFFARTAAATSLTFDPGRLA